MTTATLHQPHNTEAEIALLSSLFLDPGAMKLTGDLQPEHFYHRNHQMIYTAMADLTAQGKPCDLIFVTDYLKERKWLKTVGGRAGLARMLNQVLSSIRTEPYAKAIKEKWQRREMIRHGEELIKQGSDEFAAMEDVPKATRVTKAARVALSFEQVIQRVDKMYEQMMEYMEDPAAFEYELLLLSKEIGIPVSEMKRLHQMKKENSKPCQWIDALELIKASPDKFDWLIAGFLPVGTTALLYAEGGVGKTLLAYDIIKAVACGDSWNGLRTKAGKVLLMQTDEPSVVTAQNMKIAGFMESLPPGQLMINTHWQFSQMKRLKDSIIEHQPKLVVIDSLTSSNRNALVEEKDVEYGRCLYELRDIAMEFNCTVVILHHENKMGGIRGSTSLKANVSEVWRFKRCDKLTSLHRVLEIEKSRSGCSGKYQMLLDPDDYSWTYQGDYDPTQHDDDSSKCQIPLKVRLLNFLEERPGVPFEPEDLAGEFGGSKDTIRKSLERLWRSGLIDIEERTKPGSKRYRVYLVKESVQSSEPLLGNDSSLGQSLDNKNTSELSPDLCPTPEPASGKGFTASDKKNTGHTPIKTIPQIGQKVTIRLQGSKYFGKNGVVKKVSEKEGKILCQVKFSDRTDTIGYLAIDLEY